MDGFGELRSKSVRPEETDPGGAFPETVCIFLASDLFAKSCIITNDAQHKTNISKSEFGKFSYRIVASERTQRFHPKGVTRVLEIVG